MMVAFIAVVLSSLFIVQAKGNQRKQKDALSTGFKLMVTVQKLIELVQQHRGITYAFNSGNTNLKDKLLELDLKIDEIINGPQKADFANFEQWTSFVEHWPKLKMHSLANDLSAANLMRQHNLVIDGQLSLLDDLTRYYELHTVMLDRFVRVAELCIDTLRTAETIAQARGLGSGICAKGQRVGADSIRLNYLKVSLLSTTKQLFIELESIDNDDLKAQFKAFANSITRNVDSFIDVLDKELLDKKELTIDTQDYFTLATKPIDDLVSLFMYVVNYSSKQY